MSKKISLSNFLKQTPEIPQYSEKNQHYLISGSHPTYYVDKPGIQEEQIAPLIASNTWTEIPGFIGLNISDMCPSTEGTYSAYFIKHDSYVYGVNIDSNTQVGIGYPDGGVANTSRQKLNCYNGYLLAVTNDSSYPTIKRTLLPGSSWTAFGSITSSSDGHFMENFLEYCMITDESSKIKKIDSTWNITSGIDLGAGWIVNGIKNFNDKYLAIAGSNGNFVNNYLFLWNGRSSSYNYSMKIPGRFMGMKVVDSILYVAVWANGSGDSISNGKTSIYYMSGTTLKQLFTPQISAIQSLSGNKFPLFNFNNKLGINLSSKDLIINGSSDAGKETFSFCNGINATGYGFDQFTETYDGYLITYTSSPSAGDRKYFLDFTSSTYNSILYKSHWIPVKNLKAIDIVYDIRPQSGTDAINVTIYGDGEDIIAGTSTTVLDSITPTNYLNEKRTRLDVKGFAGDKVKIQLSTVNTGTWRPIIREINLILE